MLSENFDNSFQVHLEFDWRSINGSKKYRFFPQFISVIIHSDKARSSSRLVTGR